MSAIKEQITAVTLKAVCALMHMVMDWSNLPMYADSTPGSHPVPYICESMQSDINAQILLWKFFEIKEFLKLSE